MSDQLPEFQPDGSSRLGVFEKYQGKGPAHIVESRREHCTIREVLGSGLHHFKVRAILIPNDDRIGPITVKGSTDGFAWFEVTGRDVPESISKGRYTTAASAIAIIEEWLYELTDPN